MILDKDFPDESCREVCAEESLLDARPQRDRDEEQLPPVADTVRRSRLRGHTHLTSILRRGQKITPFSVHGDKSGCSLGFVDSKIKVAF